MANAITNEEQQKFHLTEKAVARNYMEDEMSLKLKKEFKQLERRILTIPGVTTLLGYLDLLSYST